METRNVRAALGPPPNRYVTVVAETPGSTWASRRGTATPNANPRMMPKVGTGQSCVRRARTPEQALLECLREGHCEHAPV